LENVVAKQYPAVKFSVMLILMLGWYFLIALTNYYDLYFATKQKQKKSIQLIF